MKTEQKKTCLQCGHWCGTRTRQKAYCYEHRLGSFPGSHTCDSWTQRVRKVPPKKEPKPEKKCCPSCGQTLERKGVDYGDFTQYEVRCLIAEYCMSVTLGSTGWGVAFKTWVELRGIAVHKGMFRLERITPKSDAQ